MRRKRGVFLIDCSLMMIISFICLFVIVTETSYIVKLHSKPVLDSGQLLYLSMVTNKLVNSGTVISISDDSLMARDENNEYLFRLKSGNLYLYKNGSGTQILARGIREATFVQQDRLVTCTLVMQDDQVVEWGIGLYEG